MTALLRWSAVFERTAVAAHTGGNVVTVFGKRPLTHMWCIVWIPGFSGLVQGLLLVPARAKTLEVFFALLGAFWLVLGVLSLAGVSVLSVRDAGDGDSYTACWAWWLALPCWSSRSACAGGSW